MDRIAIAPRPGWPQTVADQGLIWHSEADRPYWDESGCYRFTLAEIEMIEAATEDVYRLFLAAGERIAGDRALMARFGIPDWCMDAVAASWHDRPPALDHGRFDFGYDGISAPALFEFNCDTPTALLETAVIQWNWKEDVFPGHDQFNSLHERLIDAWRRVAGALPGGRLWFGHVADEAHEDTITTTYLRELAETAGIETLGVVIDDIGLDAAGRIVDGDDRLISAIFKLYPWEWIVAEPFGRDIVRHLPDTLWIEPIWKMIWSNKAILPVLWEMFPGHPNLLPAGFTAADAGPDHVIKPCLAREGANIALVEGGRLRAQAGGGYDGPCIYQQLYRLRDFGRGYPVLGCWVVGGEAAGMGIREDGLITGNTARFVPHIISG
ncbi:glutathionylspermidine synthase family protein [Sphingomonas changnyeongensis]|uniref:glutathionylspermidine synthase family protein n=1 Tax=Sphingomonas changnyeongensis TaxID=2698679 RepID=UPI001E3BEDA5|nr:glutathionylspermidine synthase family protein [Sphingomonas changnyeongensis]